MRGAEVSGIRWRVSKVFGYLRAHTGLGLEQLRMISPHPQPSRGVQRSKQCTVQTTAACHSSTADYSIDQTPAPTRDVGPKTLTTAQLTVKMSRAPSCAPFAK